MALLKLLTSALGAFVLYGVYVLVKFLYDELTSPLRDLPGPENPSFLYGNLRQLKSSAQSSFGNKWIEEYGPTFRYKSLFSATQLFTLDSKALNHIVTNTLDYQKPEHTRHRLAHAVGPGVLVVEGEKHRQQRKIMNPAFGPAQIRELTETFVEKSIQLRDIWLSETHIQGGTGRIDALSWLNRMTLDVIGLAGFNYSFNALNDDGKPDELSQAFARVFQSGTKSLIFPLFQARIPLLRWIPTQRDRDARQAQATMARIGKQLLSDAKASVVASEKDGSKSGLQGRALLTLLVKSNMSTRLSDRLSDEDVLAQVPTFLVAGHETTSTGTTWALFSLSQNSEIQNKLRDELFTVSTDNPSMEELNSLPYLDWVVRETLRLHSPVPATSRVAMKDDILPLKTPWVDGKGVVRHGIRVRKGQQLIIPIVAINQAKAIWGVDSMEFKPERWESIPEAATSIPGIWGHVLSFLGGPRACIGYRFSLVEMKALLFTLIRAFEFELAVPADQIIKKQDIVQRPIVSTDPDGGNQLPLLVKPYRRD